jgi:hypothetical protein
MKCLKGLRRRSCADAADALQGVTNARMSGQDPSADKLKSLLWHSLRSPEQHGTGAYWGAQHAPGSAALSNNVKLAVFGHALQVVVEDLLMSDTKVRACAAAALCQLPLGQLNQPGCDPPYMQTTSASNVSS